MANHWHHCQVWHTQISAGTSDLCTNRQVNYTFLHWIHRTYIFSESCHVGIDAIFAFQTSYTRWKLCLYSTVWLVTWREVSVLVGHLWWFANHNFWYSLVSVGIYSWICKMFSFWMHCVCYMCLWHLCDFRGSVKDFALTLHSCYSSQK